MLKWICCTGVLAVSHGSTYSIALDGIPMELEAGPASQCFPELAALADARWGQLAHRVGAVLRVGRVPPRGE